MTEKDFVEMSEKQFYEYLQAYHNGDVSELKKELHIENRFINDIDNGKLIDTKGELSTIYYSDSVDFYELWGFLNKLNEENEQLKQRYDAQRDLYAQLNSDYNNVYNENRELKQLLKEVEHELTTITGLSAFDKCASQLGYVEVFDEDYWELDYSEILQKIDKIQGDVE